MKRKASKPRSVEQIIRILRQADGGQTVAEICREPLTSRKGPSTVGRSNMAAWRSLRRNV